MRRIAKPLLSLLTVSLLASGSLLAAEDSSLEMVRVKIDSLFEEISPENVNTSPIDGWYTVQKGSTVAYVSADGRYLLQGDLIDLDQQVNLSERSRLDARKTLMSSIKDEKTILFSPEEVKYSVTVFTDVDCSYCRKLHSQIDEYLAQGIQIRYLLYPRNGPTSPSWSTSEDVWCARDRNAALTAAKLGRNVDTLKCDVSTVTQHYMLGRDVGLNGTPAIVFDDGTLISGYLPPEALSTRLQQAEALN